MDLMEYISGMKHKYFADLKHISSSLLLKGALLYVSLIPCSKLNSPVLPEPISINITQKRTLERKLYDAYMEIHDKFALDCNEKALIVDGEHQRLYLVHIPDERIQIDSSYIISTAKKGFGNTKDAETTPLGIHKVNMKVGGGKPRGTIFKEWSSLDVTAKIYDTKPSYHVGALMNSRMIFLKGCEKSNKNSYERNVYFHGTNIEYKLGKRASHGCIRMRNGDHNDGGVIGLYDIVKNGTYVYIADTLR